MAAVAGGSIVVEVRETMVVTCAFTVFWHGWHVQLLSANAKSWRPRWRRGTSWSGWYQAIQGMTPTATSTATPAWTNLMIEVVGDGNDCSTPIPAVPDVMVHQKLSNG